MNKNKLLMFFIINGLFNLAANYAHPITPTVIKIFNWEIICLVLHLGQ